MERLTCRDADGNVNHQWEFNGVNGSYDILDEELLGKQIDRLAAYEDTGLEPEEIYEVRFLIAAQRDPQKLARLRELVLADQNGQLVVLPCKVGDTIWRIKCFADWPDIGKPYVEADAFLYRDIHYFGKTVFLTREEAEAALAGKGGG